MLVEQPHAHRRLELDGCGKIILKQDDRLILVIGACEQHGYLSLLTDIRIPAGAGGCRLAAGRPYWSPRPLNYGASPYFTALSAAPSA